MELQLGALAPGGDTWKWPEVGNANVIVLSRHSRQVKWFLVRMPFSSWGVVFAVCCASSFGEDGDNGICAWGGSKKGNGCYIRRRVGCSAELYG